MRTPAEWAWLAGQAGLPAQPVCLGDTIPAEDTTTTPGVRSGLRGIIFDGRFFGSPKFASLLAAMQSSVARLAELSGLRLFGADFVWGPDGERFFAGATIMPDLRLGGEPLLDALAEALR
jgi:hypothetical protein